jgi:endo-1,4-beta-xylanase
MRKLISLFVVAILLSHCTTSVKNNNAKPVALKSVYSDYFTMGMAVNYRLLNSADTSLVNYHFGSITAENCMKPEVLQPSEGVWNWEQADALIAYAKLNKLKVHGHCLVWHEQTPNWFFTDGDKPASKELLFERMQNHITTVMHRYKDDVQSWDVVNEAVADETNRIYREKDSPWFQITGNEFIAKAFEFANAADPNALLFYNDYNSARPEKRERIYTLLKTLVDSGVPIHGVGLQGHWSIYEPSEEDLRKAIEQFSSLGLQVRITELDVSMYLWEKERRDVLPDETISYTPEWQQKQDKQYEMIFRVCRENKDVVSGITFWGLADNNSWLNNYPAKGRKNYPLLFDENRQPKSCFYNITEFEKTP